MLTEDELIKGCKNFIGIAQKELYYRYSGKMRGICARYIRDPDEAKDVLQEGFIKVFSNIHTYSGKGSLEGWIKRIIINTAINHYHKKKKNPLDHIKEDGEEFIEAEEVNSENNETSYLDMIIEAGLPKEEILNSLNILSDSYRIVFNMYYLENFSHKEIGDILKINESTSRTRLFRGKKQLQKYLEQIYEKKIHAHSKVNK